MSSVGSTALADYLSDVLDVAQHPDYAHALNGLQVANRGPVRRIGACVDLSRRTISLAVEAGVNFMIVHHGMFWGGLRPIAGPMYERVQALLESDVAVYSVHLPLDSSPRFGNSLLLAKKLDLVPDGPFCAYSDRFVGVRGACDVATRDLIAMIARFAEEHESQVRTTPIHSEQRTRRWAIVTGAGASSDTLRQATLAAVDTLIVGEGPHHTAIEAQELGVTVVYAGHYATEALGVQALAQEASRHFALPWTFLPAPTGL